MFCTPLVLADSVLVSQAIHCRKTFIIIQLRYWFFVELRQRSFGTFLAGSTQCERVREKMRYTLTAERTFHLTLSSCTWIRAAHSEHFKRQCFLYVVHSTNGTSVHYITWVAVAACVQCTVYIHLSMCLSVVHTLQSAKRFSLVLFLGCYYVVSSGYCWCYSRWFVSYFFRLLLFSRARSHFTSQSLRTNYPREMEAKIADAAQMLSKKRTTTFSLLHFGQYAAKSAWAQSVRWNTGRSTINEISC